jgi:hypothetical protein
MLDERPWTIVSQKRFGQKSTNPATGGNRKNVPSKAKIFPANYNVFAQNAQRFYANRLYSVRTAKGFVESVNPQEKEERRAMAFWVASPNPSEACHAIGVGGDF